MIQDIYPHKLNNQYDLKAVPSPNSPVLVFDGPKVLADTNGWLRIPSAEEVGMDKEFIFLFRLDDTAYFLSRSFKAELPGYTFTDVRAIRDLEDAEKHHKFAIMTGKHLSDWYRDFTFCGRCGNRMNLSDKERAMVCPECGNTAYPRIMPAVIVGVINGDSILITRYRKGYQHNALVAGFTEIGETLEETVAREVMEEAGVRVKNIKYYRSQPWGMASDILMGFFCEVDGSTEIHMDENELQYAEWVKREDVVPQPGRNSLTNEMMIAFKEGRKDLL